MHIVGDESFDRTDNLPAANHVFRIETGAMQAQVLPKSMQYVRGAVCLC